MQSIVCKYPKLTRQLRESVSPRALPLVMSAGLTALSLFVVLSDGESSPPLEFRHEIFENGDALFTAMEGARQVRRWTVTCPRPLRGCVARASGLVLHIDGEGQIRLAGVSASGAQITIESGGHRTFAPNLFAAPLERNQVAALTKVDSVLVVSNHDDSPVVTETAGLAVVANYLSFLASPLARTLRDARVWRSDRLLDPDDMETTVRSRFEILRRRAAQADA